jgi:hypothetical protein
MPLHPKIFSCGDHPAVAAAGNRTVRACIDLHAVATFGCPHLADVRERPYEWSATTRRSHNGRSGGCHRCPLCCGIWHLGEAMLVYRVFPYLPQATSGEAGHAMHVHAQGSGRLDNPSHYRIWYLALEQAGAIAEAFGDLDEWGSAMFDCPLITGSRRALATYLLSDYTPLLDLDDSRNLLTRGLRPTQVIERNRAATQSWALTVFNERNDRYEQVWQGVRWWSYHRPQWRIIGYWGETAPQLLVVEELDLTSPAVIDASTSLMRSGRPSSLTDSDAVASGSSVSTSGQFVDIEAHADSGAARRPMARTGLGR